MGGGWAGRGEDEWLGWKELKWVVGEEERRETEGRVSIFVRLTLSFFVRFSTLSDSSRRTEETSKGTRSGSEVQGLRQASDGGGS